MQHCRCLSVVIVREEEEEEEATSSFAIIVVIVAVMLLHRTVAHRRLGGSGGAKLHRCRRRSLVSHPSSSAVSSWRRRLRAMLLRAVFSRWRSATSFCRLLKKNFVHRCQDAVTHVPAVLLGLGLLPPAKEEGGGVPPPIKNLLVIDGARSPN